MRKFDLNQVKKQFIHSIKKITSWKDLQFDEEGRLSFMSDLYIHADGSFWDEPDELSDTSSKDTVPEDNEPVVEETITFEQLAQLEAELEAAHNEDALNNTTNSTQDLVA